MKSIMESNEITNKIRKYTDKSCYRLKQYEIKM